jgi:DNA-binding MarR family transcriptional regulator
MRQDPCQGKPAATLADRLHSVAVHLLRRIRRVDRASRLSGPALSALSVIVHGGPMPLGALARAEQVRAPTMTRLVQGLQRLGLVAVHTDRDDRRRRQVTATAAGRRLLQVGRARRVVAVAEVLEGLTLEQRRQLVRALDILERRLPSTD